VLPANADARFLDNRRVRVVHATEELSKTCPGQRIQKQVSVITARFVFLTTER
jgi:hypothetical protein